MPEQLDITVSDNGGAKKVADDIKGIGTSATQTETSVESLNKSLDGIKSILEILGVGVTVAWVSGVLDGYTQIINKLKTVSTSYDDLIQKEQTLFNVSQQTRQGFAGTVELYEGLQKATSGLNVSQSDLVGIVTTVNQSMTISGKSAENTAQVMKRFTESLAEGSAQGRGLQTVLVQFPDLARDIANGLGISIASLKAMGEAGTLSTQMILRGLQSAAPEVAARFAQITPTISGAFTVLENSVTRFIGQLGQGSGAAGVFATAILFVANHLTTLLNGLITVGSYIATVFAIGRITPWFTTMAVGLAAIQAEFAAAGISMLALLNPINLVRIAGSAMWAGLTGGLSTLIPLLVTAGTFIYTFGSQINLVSDGTVTLKGLFVGTFEYIVQELGIAYNAIAKWFQTSTIGKLLATVLQEIADAIGAIVGLLGKVWDLWTKGADTSADKTKTLSELIKEASTNVNGLATNFDHAADAAKDAGNTMIKSLIPSIQDIEAEDDRLYAQWQRNVEQAKAAATAYLNAYTELATGIQTADDAVNQLAVDTGKSSDNFSKMAESAVAASTAIETIVSPSSSSSSSSSSNSSSSSFTNLSAAGAIALSQQSFAKMQSLQLAALANPDDPNAQVAAAQFTNYVHTTPFYVGNGVFDPLAYVPGATVANPFGDVGGYKLPTQYRTFATGGSFDVGGSGGTDSQLVQFRASPDERVTIETPSQQRDSTLQKTPQINVNLNVYGVTDADSFNRSKTQIAAATKKLITSAGERLKVN